MTQLVRVDQTQPNTQIQPAPQYSAEQIALLKRTLTSSGTDLTDDELALFIEICKRTRLDPFSKQIYAIKRGGRLTPQTSIDGFRLIATRSREYRGQLGPLWCGDDGVWKDVWLDRKHPPKAAKVGVLREGFPEPIWSVANFETYDQKQNFWIRGPEHMIAKCAEALALRRAFPSELGGLHTEEELAAVSDGIRPPREEAEALVLSGELKSPDMDDPGNFRNTFGKDFPGWTVRQIYERKESDGEEGFREYLVRVRKFYADKGKVVPTSFVALEAKGLEYIAQVEEQSEPQDNPIPEDRSRPRINRP